MLEFMPVTIPGHYATCKKLCTVQITIIEMPIISKTIKTAQCLFNYCLAPLPHTLLDKYKEKLVFYRIPTRISAGVGDHPCFLTFYNYDPY